MHYMQDTKATRDEVNKVLISQYVGTSFVAEREGEFLNIYMMGGPASTNANVSNVPGTMSDHAGPMTPAKMQRINEASRKRA